MDHKSWLDWWTKMASEYFTDKSWGFSRPELIERLGLNPNWRVLEVGFGYGRELAGFCSVTSRVCGVELTDWACEHTLIELGKRGISPLPELRSYDGLVLPYPDGSFNLVYSCFVVQHLSREHALGLMVEALRVVAPPPHGHVLFEFFGDPKYQSDAWQDVLCKNEEKGPMFNNAFNRVEVVGMVEAAGGNLEWLETKSVTKEWGNHWACFERK